MGAAPRLACRRRAARVPRLLGEMPTRVRRVQVDLPQRRQGASAAMGAPEMALVKAEAPGELR